MAYKRSNKRNPGPLYQKKCLACGDGKATQKPHPKSLKKNRSVGLQSKADKKVNENSKQHIVFDDEKKKLQDEKEPLQEENIKMEERKQGLPTKSQGSFNLKQLINRLKSYFNSSKF